VGGAGGGSGERGGDRRWIDSRDRCDSAAADRVSDRLPHPHPLRATLFPVGKGDDEARVLVAGRCDFSAPVPPPMIPPSPPPRSQDAPGGEISTAREGMGGEGEGWGKKEGSTTTRRGDGDPRFCLRRDGTDARSRARACRSQ